MTKLSHAWITPVAVQHYALLRSGWKGKVKLAINSAESFESACDTNISNPDDEEFSVVFQYFLLQSESDCGFDKEEDTFDKSLVDAIVTEMLH